VYPPLFLSLGLLHTEDDARAAMNFTNPTGMHVRGSTCTEGQDEIIVADCLATRTEIISADD
jgi:hypothetical protein